MIFISSHKPSKQKPYIKMIEVTVKVPTGQGQYYTKVLHFNNPTSDQDIELELVHDSNGNPLVRPKQAPKY